MHSILFFVPLAMSLLFFVAIFFVILGKRNQNPHGAKFAIAGVVIMALARVGQVLLHAYLTRGLDQQSLVAALGISNIIETGLNLMGIGLITAGVFAFRGTLEARSTLGRADTYDENPYATPQSNSVP